MNVSLQRNHSGSESLVKLGERGLVLLIVLLGVSACATRPAPDVTDTTPAEVEERLVIDGEVLPLPRNPAITVEPLLSKPNMSPVVRKLMDSARTQSRAADYDGAANSLERALRIEPRSALLWNRLADVRFAQKSWKQAIQLAAKSNTLTRNDADLRRRNWYLMANAYEASGEIDAAQKYRNKLRQ